MVAPSKSPCLGLLGETWSTVSKAEEESQFPTAERAEEPSGVNHEKQSFRTNNPILHWNLFPPPTQNNFICRMEMSLNESTTPGGNLKKESTIAMRNVSGPRILGSPTTCIQDESERLETPSKLKFKKKYFIGTVNVNSLLRVGKQKELEKLLDDHEIQILAVQETRFLDEHIMDTQQYRVFKGKPAIKIMINTPLLGTAFYVNKTIVNNVINFSSKSERLSTLTIKCKNKKYTLINCHAPINEDNKKNPQKVDDFWDLLETEISRIPVNHTKILLGDFNAQIGRERKYRHIVGDYPAHRRTNQNGERLIGLCKTFQLKLMSTHFRKLPRKAKTWVSPNPNLGEFQLDHVAITRTNTREVMNVKVIRDGKFDSDHYLSKVKMRFLPPKQKRDPPKVTKYNTNRMNINQDIINKFREEIRSTTKETWQHLRTGINEAAKKTLGLAKTKRTIWWNEECEKALEKRVDTWKRWKSSGNMEHWEHFREQRKETSRIFRRVKRSFEKAKLQNLQDSFTKNNSRDFFQTFKDKLKGYQLPSVSFKNEQGKIGLNNQENCNILARYFEKLLNCPPPTTKLEHLAPTENLEDDMPPTKEEIKEALKSLKNNKASGEDSISAEMLKWAEPEILDDLHRIFQQIWETEKLPEEWKTALIYPLHKKGDKQDVNNYRGVSLLPVTYKILSKILLNRTEGILDKQLGEYQGGFRKGRSCAEQIFNLKSIIRHRMLTGKNIVVSFIDFKKAFDSVDRETLDKIIREFGVKKKLANIIRETLTGTTSKVKFMGELSVPFEIKTGVRQGDGLSPILFNCVLEKIVRIWNSELESQGISPICLGRKSGGIKVNCLAFADDFAILSENLEEAAIQINLLERIAGKTGLRISKEKTKFMTCDKHGAQFLETDIGRIERVKKFKYLGEVIQENGLEKAAVGDRISKMERAYGLTKNIYNKKCVSWNAKIKHYNVVVKTECLYASECLSMNYKLEKLDILERRIVRKIMGPIQVETGWKLRSNNEIYKKVEKISETMKKRRLSFLGHLYRMDKTRLTKRIFDYLWKKKTTTTWIKEVRKDLERFSIQEIQLLNRDTFRTMIQNLEGFQVERTKKTGRAWTDEQKQQHSVHMKEYWRKRKLQTKKK